MKDLLKRQRLFFISLIGIVVVSLVLGTTFAYQTIVVEETEGSKSGITINIGKLNVTYTKTNIISLDNMPLVRSYKDANYVEFTLNPNDTTEDVAFKINLENIIYGYTTNETKTQGCRTATNGVQAACLSSNDFKYTLVDTEYNVISEGDFSDLSTTSPYTTDYEIGDSITLKQGNSKTYRLYLWLEETKENQNSLENTYFQAKINIISVFKSELPTLKDVIMADSRIVKNEGTPTFTNASSAEEGMYSAEDDYGTSWYFRGVAPYNYVNFAGFMWRIVRINGDGSIRLILDGTLDTVKREGTSVYAGDAVNYNIVNDANAYIGYMYGLTGTNEYNCVVETDGVKSIDTSITTEEACTNGEWLSGYDTTHMNLNDSTIKKEVDKFYETYIENDTYHYEEYLADTLFCNDKTITEGLGYGSQYNVSGAKYSAISRLNSSPTLECAKGATNNYSRFTSKLETATTTSENVNINNDLKHPIALLTADEFIMAGSFQMDNDLGADGTYGYLVKFDNWLTMTPSQTDYSVPDESYGYIYGMYDYNFSDYGNMTESGVRPVINLKSDILWESGDGTSGEGAYKVKLMK